MGTLTLLERIEAAQSASRAGTVRFIAGDEVEAVPWGRILDDAVAAAARMQAAGVGPGAHVALLGTTSRAMVTAIEATWLCGATVVMLPLPLRLASLEAFVAQTRARVAHADAALLLIDPELAGYLEPAPGHPAVHQRVDR